MIIASSFRIAAAAATMSIATSAFAALPPYYQRAREIAAISESSEVQEALRGAPIESIVWTGADRVRVKGGNCSADVLIVDTGRRSDPPGPRKFRLKVKKPLCA